MERDIYAENQKLFFFQVHENLVIEFVRQLSWKIFKRKAFGIFFNKRIQDNTAQFHILFILLSFNLNIHY